VRLTQNSVKKKLIQQVFGRQNSTGPLRIDELHDQALPKTNKHRASHAANGGLKEND
jgi:hypothetical protein